MIFHFKGVSVVAKSNKKDKWQELKDSGGFDSLKAEQTSRQIPLNIDTNKWDIKYVDGTNKEKLGDGIKFILDKLRYDIFQTLKFKNAPSYEIKESVFDDLYDFLLKGEVTFYYERLRQDVVRKSFLPYFKLYKDTLSMFDDYILNCVNPQTTILINQKTVEYSEDERRGLRQRLRDIVKTKANAFSTLLKGEEATTVPSRQSNPNIKATVDSLLMVFGLSMDLLTGKADARECFLYMKQIYVFASSFFDAIKLKYRTIIGVNEDYYRYWSVADTSSAIDKLVYQSVICINEGRSFLNLEPIPYGDQYFSNLNAIPLSEFANRSYNTSNNPQTSAPPGVTAENDPTNNKGGDTESDRK